MGTGKVCLLTRVGAAGVICASMLASMSALANNGPSNFFGSYNKVAAGDLVRDPTKPVPNRSYFLPSIRESQNGGKLVVDLYHGYRNTRVSLWLQIAINDGAGYVEFIPFRQLSDQVADNPQLYYSQRIFDLDYDSLNADLEKTLGKGALPANLKIGPGTPLFVFANWHDIGSSGHQWGGAARGGIFFMPENSGQVAQQAASGATRRVTELDIGYEITNLMAGRFNTSVVQANGARVSVGIKENGQIKSRLESEGKYQIPLAEANKVKARLYELANDHKKATALFGSDWTFVSETRYMKTDASGQLLKDHQGLPIPDPMVDTMYDNDSSDAAKNDYVIRWRKTEGNGYGSWNFKPGTMVYSKEGIADRLESSVDATDEKPETIQTYADSNDPLNIFANLRALNSNSKPSDYFKPSLTQPDIRHKFKLTHRSGLVIEVSFDDVTVESHRSQNPVVMRYIQVEMDVDHPSVQSTNVLRAQGGGLSSSYSRMIRTFTSKAFIDGRPVMHTLEDLEANSPINVKLANDKALAEQAIVALRNDVIGANWLPGANKGALSAFLAGHVKPSEVSPSVKRLLRQARARFKADARNVLFEVDREATCRNVFK